MSLCVFHIAITLSMEKSATAILSSYLAASITTSSIFLSTTTDIIGYSKTNPIVT